RAPPPPRRKAARIPSPQPRHVASVLLRRRYPPAPRAAYTRPARVSCPGACLHGRRSSSILAAGSRPLRMVSNPLLVALALGLVVVNAFFVAAEFAMVRVRATRVEALAAEGHWQARLAATLHRRLDVFLSATQLGITLTSLGLGWIGEPAFAHLLAPVFAALGIESARVIENTSIAVAFATITFLHIVVGELAPKSFAIRFTERVALLTAPPMRLFQILFTPALWLLHRASKATLSVLGVSAETSGDLAHSEDELRILLAESHRLGELSAAKRQLLENVIDYTERTARHVMVPRADIAYLSLERSLEDNLAAVTQAAATRFPLCSSDIDHVIGMIHVKDLFNRREQLSDAAEGRQDRRREARVQRARDAGTSRDEGARRAPPRTTRDSGARRLTQRFTSR